MTINWGDYQQMPDYRAGWIDKNRNAFGGLLRTFDPMTYVPGLNAPANAAHDIGGNFVSGVNRILSPVVGAAQDFTQATTPGMKQVQQATGMEGIDRFVRDKPFDAAALAAASFFTGGAAAEALGPSAAAAAPAASGGAGAMGGMSSASAAGSAAITPAFQSGAVAGSGLGAGAAGSTTGSLVGASSITPALSSGAYGGMAGAAGASTLGTAGTAAATGLLTPSMNTLGTGTGLMGSLKPYTDGANTADRFRRNFNNVSQPNQDEARLRKQQNALAQRIIDDPQPKRNVKRISDQIMMNNFQKGY
jgi:hypothetical protein